jgi:hypothetical protein
MCLFKAIINELSLDFFLVLVLCADKLCTTLKTVLQFLSRPDFSRKDAEALWARFQFQRKLHWHNGSGRWTALLEELGQFRP